jgi:predicted MFS family arabinose efflux permease
MSTDIWWTILGRVLQGAGAISAAVNALAADLTREQHRTKIMALLGSSIGVVFPVSLILAPALYAVIGMNGIFWITTACALGAIGVVTHLVPPAPPLPHGPKPPFHEVLFDTRLLRLNFGIFTLHLTMMAVFVVVPGLLIRYGELPLAEHWKVYLPVVLASFLLMVPAIIVAEKRDKIQPVFVLAIALLLATFVLFWLGGTSFAMVIAGLLCFFVAFNILEAMLPSLISRIAPPRAKGAALGVYNTTQSLGLFLGGAMSGWLLKNFSSDTVFILAAAMATAWLVLALTMAPVPLRRAAATAKSPPLSGIPESNT